MKAGRDSSSPMVMSGVRPGTDRETLCRVKLGVALTPGNSTRADLEEVTDHWAQLDEPRSK